jgi:hypothetical protein
MDRIFVFPLPIAGACMIISQSRHEFLRKGLADHSH